METQTSVFERVAESKKNAYSSRSRILAFLLAFILPMGAHNYYLGYTIKAIVQTLALLGIIIFIPPVLFIFVLPFYVGWITSEGLLYLLYAPAKDGDGFPMAKDIKNARIKEKNVVLLAFLLPFGLHNIYKGNFVKGFIVWVFTAFVISIHIIILLVPGITLIGSTWILLVIPVLLSWLEGLWLLIKK